MILLLEGADGFKVSIIKYIAGSGSNANSTGSPGVALLKSGTGRVAIGSRAESVPGDWRPGLPVIYK